MAGAHACNLAISDCVGAAQSPTPKHLGGCVRVCCSLSSTSESCHGTTDQAGCVQHTHEGAAPQHCCMLSTQYGVGRAHQARGPLNRPDGRGAGVIGREGCVGVVARARHQPEADGLTQYHGVGLDSDVWVGRPACRMHRTTDGSVQPLDALVGMTLSGKLSRDVDQHCQLDYHAAKRTGAKPIKRTSCRALTDLGCHRT